MNDMIHLNEGFNYYDAQPGIPEDLVEDSKSGIYGLTQKKQYVIWDF